MKKLNYGDIVKSIIALQGNVTRVPYQIYISIEVPVNMHPQWDAIDNGVRDYLINKKGRINNYE